MCEVNCPDCQLAFSVEEYENGNCPCCDKEYWWQDVYYEPPVDDWYTELIWD